MFEFDLSKLWEAVQLLVAGAIGAMVSLPFHSEIKTYASRFTAVCFGSASAHYLTPLVLDYFSIAITRSGGVAFLLGLFGMSATAAVFRTLGNADVWSLIQKRFGGDSQE